MELAEFKKIMWRKGKDSIIVKEVNLPKDHVGWLVIDSLGYGSSAGGIRLGENVNLDEVKLLAKEMTLKRLFYNQKIGGAKAGLCYRNSLANNEREIVFKAFGKALKPFIVNKIYVPGTDLGTTQKDINYLYEGAGIIIANDTKNNGDCIDSSYYTAVSIFAALKSVASFYKIKLKDSRIGIQGLGKVGLNLLKLASEHNIILVAASTQHGAIYSPKGLDVAKIFDLATKYGDQFINYYNGAQTIKLDQFFSQDMDIMCPCAGIYPINRNNIECIKAKIIIPGCNVAATEKIEKQLYESGIRYLPGFVCNAGGVLGYTLQRLGLEKDQRSDILSQGIQNKVTYLLRQSERLKTSPLDVTRTIVSRNQEKFAFESNARIKGKFALLNARWVVDGTSGVANSILLKIIERKPVALKILRKHLAQRIAFESYFKDHL